MDNTELVNLLEKQAEEIADDGHAGWGNTMKLAAERIAQLTAEIVEIQNQDAEKSAYHCK